MNNDPIAPPALKTPFAVAIAVAEVVSYSGSPFRGKSKASYQPGWPKVLVSIDEQYPYV